MSYGTLAMDMEEIEGIKKLESFKTRLEEKETLTPLWVLLYIFNQAEPSCMGFRGKGLYKLIEWLQPIEFPTYELLPTPKLLRNHALEISATWLGCSTQMVYTCMVKEVAILPQLKEYKVKYFAGDSYSYPDREDDEV